MKSLILSGKVKPDMGGQVLDLYNQQVYQGIAPTMLTTIDSSSMTFVTTMSKEIFTPLPTESDTPSKSGSTLQEIVSD